MPAYDYRCRHCGYTRELRHGMHERAQAALLHCPLCRRGSLRKAPSAAPAVYKTSGFYSVDSRIGRSDA